MRPGGGLGHNGPMLTRVRGTLLGAALALTVLATAAVTDAAAAPPEPSAVATQEAELRRYFTGERNGGIWLMSVGAPAAVAGAGLLVHPGEYYRGLGYPLLAVGALEFLGGLLFYLNTNRRVPRLLTRLGQSPAELQAAELARLRRVNRELALLTTVEITLMVASGAMTAVSALRGLDTLSGVGTGLLIESTVLFIYDQLAARRALRYTDSLLHFSAALISGPQGPAGAASGSSLGSGGGLGLAPRGALLTVQGQF